MHWILQDRFFHPDACQVLLDTLLRFDIPHSLHKVVPFVGGLIPEPELTHRNVLCMGSLSLRHAARQLGWTPGVFDLETHTFTEQLAHWGTHLLNHDAVVTTFERAHFTEEVLFARPLEDSKVFAGKLYTREEFENWREQVCVLGMNFGTSLRAGTPIQLCSPKTIYSEHRFWVVKGRMAGSSTYKMGRAAHYQSVADARFQEYAESRVAEWQPLETFVIDVCDTADGLKIVEINTLNSCAFYAANMQKLAMALQEGYDIRG